MTRKSGHVRAALTRRVGADTACRSKRRKFLAALGAGAFAVSLASFAQQQPKVRRIGFLAMRSRPTRSNPDYYSEFPQAMRELGYIEGQNLVIEWRFADGKFERLPTLAAELVRLNVEVIVTHSTQGILAVQRETRTIPIVTAAVGDPVGSGFAASLARPGGNITGLSLVIIDVSPKHVELLKIMVPGLSRLAVLVNPDNASHPPSLKSVQAAAQQANINVVAVDARGNAEDIERGFSMMSKGRAQAVVIESDAFFIGNRQLITQLAAKNRIPSMFAFREDVEAGGLMSYGQNVAEFYRRAAVYVDKILKGAKPGDLPFEQPTKYELVINRKTAKALGLTIPQELVLRADKVIE